jgi:1-acyl-sn-glycerol-3-phosphate acyltransferase
MFDRWKQKLIHERLSEEEIRRVEAAVERHLNSAGYDPWGLDPETVKISLAATKWLYRDYFRVDTIGLENMPAKRVLLIANHGGQLPIDAFLIGISMILEAEPPRIVRGMFERWATRLPFISTYFGRLGQVVGDQRNCLDLLRREEAVLVFPEGVAGSGKTIQHRYELQKFGTGFMRLALETRTPIVPVAVIGAEEAYPSVLNLKPLAKAVGAPYLPITPFFPLLGPVGAIPLPTKCSLRFGEPLFFEGDPDAPDAEIEKKIDRVREALAAEIAEGLRLRDDKLFTGSGAIEEAEEAREDNTAVAGRTTTEAGERDDGGA